MDVSDAASAPDGRLRSLEWLYLSQSASRKRTSGRRRKLSSSNSHRRLRYFQGREQGVECEGRGVR